MKKEKMKITVKDVVNELYLTLKLKPYPSDELVKMLKEKYPNETDSSLKYCIKNMPNLSEIKNYREIFYVDNDHRKIAYDMYIQRHNISKPIFEQFGHFIITTNNFLIVNDKEGKGTFLLIFPKVYDIMEGIGDYTIVFEYEDGFLEKIKDYNEQIPEELKKMREDIKERRRRISSLNRLLIEERISIVDYERKTEKAKSLMMDLVGTYSKKMKEIEIKTGFKKVGTMSFRKGRLIIYTNADRKHYVILESDLNNVLNGDYKSGRVWLWDFGAKAKN